MRSGELSSEPAFLRDGGTGRPASSALADILRNPDYFPDRIDPATGRIRFVATSRGVLNL